MDDYCKEDVIKALNTIQMNSRKRVLVDQRSYLIGILYEKFKLTEHAIAKITGLNRSRVNYSKRLPIEFVNDSLYKQNTYVYAQLFPFDFSKCYTTKPNRHHTIILSVDDKLTKKLIKIKKLLGHDDIRITVKHLLEKSIKLWEK